MCAFVCACVSLTLALALALILTMALALALALALRIPIFCIYRRLNVTPSRITVTTKEDHHLDTTTDPVYKKSNARNNVGATKVVALACLHALAWWQPVLILCILSRRDTMCAVPGTVAPVMCRVFPMTIGKTYRRARKYILHPLGVRALILSAQHTRVRTPVGAGLA
jgi:hypothetical protein